MVALCYRGKPGTAFPRSIFAPGQVLRPALAGRWRVQFFDGRALDVPAAHVHPVSHGCFAAACDFIRALAP